jgi:hypothetical protein
MWPVITSRDDGSADCGSLACLRFAAFFFVVVGCERGDASDRFESKVFVYMQTKLTQQGCHRTKTKLGAMIAAQSPFPHIPFLLFWQR